AIVVEHLAGRGERARGPQIGGGLQRGGGVAPAGGDAGGQRGGVARDPLRGGVARQHLHHARQQRVNRGVTGRGAAARKPGERHGRGDRALRRQHRHLGQRRRRGGIAQLAEGLGGGLAELGKVL